MKNSILLHGYIMRRGFSLALMMFLLTLALGAKASTVDVRMASQAAKTFLNNNGVQYTQLTDVSASAGFSNVYVFTTDNSFVLMAADDRVQPILGYSLTSRFNIENMPANKVVWIQGYSDAIQYAIEHQTRASAEVAQQWHDLVEGNPNIGRATTVVTPLIQTQWDQGEPYNNLCPDGTVTGCAATAMAQVLKYWNYPPTGIGMHAYQWNGQTVSADFGSTTYDWDNMLNSYSGSSTEAQRTAVATLMFHCGVSLDMNYGWAWSGGSGAYSSATAGAFINYFNYSSETQLLSRSNYSETDWINMVKAELNQNHPIWYCGNGSGGGHAFVCDGYNSSNYFHFNWGWSGYCDEYYSINSLSPGPGGIGSGSVGDFSNNQQALFGAQPSPESSADAPVLTATLITEPGVRNAQLNWNQVDNAVTYNVYRNGTLIHTTSSNSETSYLDVHIPYGTTTYYVRSLDQNGILSWPSNYAPVTIIFPAPTNLTATLVDGGVQLSWTPCEGALAYNVYCNNGVLANGIDQTSFSDNRPIAGELSYFIRGVDSFGDESESSDVATINVPYSTPIVDDLEASVAGNTVALSWSVPDWCFPETPSAMLNYGSDDFNGWFGYTYGSTCWGHRYPAASLTAYSNMSIYKASFYVRVAGEYQLLVYEGTIDGHPQTLVRQQAVWIDSEGWQDIVLPEKVQIDASLDYWVFFHDVNGLNCPATCCNYSGNEGNYYSRNPASGVNTIDGRAFLIHTYLTDGVYTYNLYRNGTCIANGFSDTYYNDNNLAPNTYEYYVKTNYYAGMSPASNHVTAQIAPGNYYTITATANPTEGGMVTGAGSYLQGNSCSLTATPNAGYTFSNWTENGEEVSTEATYSFTVTEERSLVANFMEDDVCAITFDLYDSYGDGWNGNKLTLTYDGGYEEITLNGGSYEMQTFFIPDGAHITLGWIAGSWMYECSFTVSYSNGNVIYAGNNLDGTSFEFDVDCEGMPTTTFEITASATPEEGGTVEGMGEYEYGSTCTLTTTANEGYRFIGWIENGEWIQGSSTYSFTVTGARDLAANFVVADSNVMVFNGDFELGNTGFSTDYIYGNTGSYNHYYVGHDIAEMWSWDSPGFPVVDHTSGEGLFMMVDGALQDNSLVWSQTVTVIPNTVYVFSAWFLTNNIGYVRFEINDVSGPDLTTPESCWVWEQRSMIWNSGNSTEATLRIINRYAQSAGYDYCIDDICFAPADSSSYLTFLSDDFNDGVIDPELWTYTGNNVYEDEGLMKLEQNVTDQLVCLWSAPMGVTPDNQIVMERRFIIHRNNNYFGRGFAIEFNGNLTPHDVPGGVCWDGQVPDGVDSYGTDFIDIHYTYDDYGSHYGTYLEWAFDNQGQYIRLCDAVFDIWLTEKVVVDLTSGTVSYYLDNAFITTVAIPELQTLQINYYTVGFGTYGWWTGHYHYMDYVNINTDLDTTYTINASANTAEGGTVSGGGEFQFGETCTLTATANEGYIFINWTKDNVEVSTEATYSFTVTENATFVANFTESQGTITQTSNFSQGYNWWSTCIEQNGMDGLGMLQDGLGDNGLTIRSQADGYTDNYAGYGWYGSLTNINNESSYRVITSAPCSVTMTGDAAVPLQHPITLSQGWTWIGYVPSTAMDVNVAMAGLTPTYGDKLKSQQGYSDYYGEDYGWFGSLNIIEPGMGLMYYLSNGESISFTYPDSNRGGELKKNITAENNHWVPNVHAYPDNMTVMAVVELDGAEISSDGYELAAFATNGECRGSVKLTYAEPLHRHVAFLTISGKDAAELSFRLYDTETGMEYSDAEESLSFVANAIVGDATDLYVIHFRGMAGMDELAKRVQVYPNPVNRGERFSINMNAESKAPIQVEIINALGVETLRATSVQTPASIVAPTVAGIYMLRITVEGKGTIVRKLVVK